MLDAVLPKAFAQRAPGMTASLYQYLDSLSYSSVLHCPFRPIAANSHLNFILTYCRI